MKSSGNNAKKRLDLLLVERGMLPSREQARASILAGQVQVDGHRVDKPGTAVSVSAELSLLSEPRPFVSRGGVKLSKAIEAFGISLEGRVVLDAGASTGGFTDCALQNGARRVYAVDVGYGQLDWRLRNDPRVVVMERTNIRYLQPEALDGPVDIVTIDVSFISLLKVLPAVVKLLQPGGEIISLIKPQFEAGRDKVGKRGVIRSTEVHAEVLAAVAEGAAQLDLTLRGLTYSPLKGPEGNIEFLAWFSAAGGGEPLNLMAAVRDTVAAAHRALKSVGDQADEHNRPGI